MKEQHLTEAMQITHEIVGLRKAHEMVTLGIWTICKIGQADDEHQYAAVTLGSNEDWIRRVAKEALLADILRQISTRRQRLKEIGVELEGEQSGEAKALPEIKDKAA